MCRNQQNGMICLVIYPKNYRFGIRSTIRNKKMKMHNYSESNFDPSTSKKRNQQNPGKTTSHQNLDTFRSKNDRNISKLSQMSTNRTSLGKNRLGRVGYTSNS